MQPVHNTSIVACSSPQSITGAGKRVRGLTWDLRRPSQSTAPKGWTIRTQSALPGMCNIFFVRADIIPVVRVIRVVLVQRLLLQQGGFVMFCVAWRGTEGTCFVFET